MKARALLPLGLAALSVLAYAAQGIVLKRTPKVGDKATYKMAGKLSVQGTEVGVSGTLSDEVTKVEEKTYTTKSTTKMTIDFAGNEMPQPEMTSTTTNNLDGSVVALKQGDTADAVALRLAHLNALVLTDKPLAVNDTWVFEGKKDDKLATPAYKLTYKLVGEEKVGKYDTYRITATGGESEGETPTKVKTDYWVDKTTGDLVQQKSELTDVVYSSQYPTPVSGTMSVLRQD